MAIVAFVAVVPLVYYLLFERGLSVSDSGKRSSQPDGFDRKTDEEPPPLPMALSIIDLDGTVEYSREGGEWKPAEIGMVLFPKDRIRTDSRSSAVLTKPGMFTVELDPGSKFEVQDLEEKASRFFLGEGMISADVVEDPERIFEVAASESVTRTKGATFKMTVNQKGLVSVGTVKGSVDVEAEGRIIQVNGGFMTRVVKGQKPADPIKIPSAVFLKVRWPKNRELSKRNIVIAGRTKPGARVKIDGTVVSVGNRGRFRQVIALKEGANKLKVESYDVGGNSTIKESPRFFVDTRPDTFDIRTSPEMWKKKKK
jgi:RNase P/RNase MRP subunit p29